MKHKTPMDRHFSYCDLKVGGLYIYDPPKDPLRCVHLRMRQSPNCFSNDDVGSSLCILPKDMSEVSFSMFVQEAEFLLRGDRQDEKKENFTPFVVLEFEYQPLQGRHGVDQTRFLIKILVDGKTGWLKVRPKILRDFKPLTV